jgi:hypothetical protein
MIETVLELLEQEMDQAKRLLSDLIRERRVLEEETRYWHRWLTDPHLLSDSSPAGIADWLSYGARADRELKNLAEKDFVVEARISDCRDTLERLMRRHQALSEILGRRARARAYARQRRSEREFSQQSQVRLAAREGPDPWP